MAKLIAGADGAYTAAATWRTIDAISGSQQFSGTAAIAVGTTPGTASDSDGWTGDSSTVDGILLQLAARGGTTGTLTAILRRTSGTPADLATVTIDLEQLPASGDGWPLFKFGSSVTLESGETYCVRVYRSEGASTLSLYAPTATTNWNRAIRTTTTAAPAAADETFISGDFTGSGAPAARTVSVDFDSTTSFGQVQVSVGGILAYATSASSAYRIRLAGDLVVNGLGYLTMGTTGTPMPGTTTAVLEFDCSTDGQYGLRGNGLFIAQGASRTYDRARLTVNVDASGTGLVTDVSTGWAIGDELAIGQTDRSSTGHSEKRTISGITGTSITIGAVTYAHSGTSPARARVIVLTRNVRIRSVSSTAMTYFRPGRYSTTDFDWAELYYLGENATGKRGVEVDVIEGLFEMDRCSVHDCEDYGLYLGTQAISDRIHCRDTVTFNMASVAGPGVTNVATSGTDRTISGCVFMQVTATSSCTNVDLLDLGLTFSSNEIIGGYVGLAMHEATFAPGTFSSIEINGTASYGLNFPSNVRNLSMPDLKIWRCSAIGMNVANGGRLTFTSTVLFGNTSANIGGGGATFGVKFIGLSSNGDGSCATTYGITFTGAYPAARWELISCNLGVTSGSGEVAMTAHTADIYLASSSAYLVDALLENTTLASPVQVANATSLGPDSSIRAQRLGGVVGAHKTWKRAGTIEPDATIFRSSAPAAKLTPASATEKLESEGRLIPIKASTLRTISVWVRKTAAYNGAAPRLIVRRNDGAGTAFDEDLVLDTAGAAADTWEQLVGTTPVADDDTAIEAIVDCDGTAGVLNVDDWEVI